MLHSPPGRFGLKLVTAPTERLLVLQDVKAYHRIFGSGEEHEVLQVINSATRWCENYTKRQFLPATWRLSLDEFPLCGERILYLPRPPAIAITSIVYIDTNGDEQTLSASAYQLDGDSEPARLAEAYGYAWPATRCQMNAVRVTYTCGWATSEAVPEDVKQAARMLVGHWLENREAVLTGTVSKEIEFSVHALLAPYKLGRLGGAGVL